MSLVQPAFMTDPSTFDAERSINHLMDMALLQQQEEDFTGAAQFYEKVLQLQPEHAEANYKLGFIETHTIGVHHAMPRFEMAVKIKPNVEQYWVGYIDALVMAEEATVAREAILVGCNYGLSQEMAQTLINELDEKTREINESLIGAEYGLQSTKFVIVAPIYTDKSAGIMVLHELCSTLNERGYQTALCLMGSDGFVISNQPQHHGPGLKWYHISGQDELQQFINEGVVIYPEIVSGNPLNAPRVVRYMLNSEGAVAKNKTQASSKDFILAFQESYHSNPDAILAKPCHFEVFNSKDSLPAIERRMDITYIGKGSHHGVGTVLPGTVEVTRVWPKTRDELAVLFKNTRYFYTWDYRSQTITDAILCGAIPVFMSFAPHTSLEDLHPEECARILGTSAKLVGEKIERFIPQDIDKRLNYLLDGYFDVIKAFDNKVDSVILKIEQHFGL